MATRTARTAWEGSLQDGTGQVELSSSGVGTFDVSFPRRIAQDAEGTSPEELVAAAHASCFAMQLSGYLGEAGFTPERLQITADVSVGPDPDDGGLHLTLIKLTVRGEVPGIEEAQFVELADKTKVSCPISKALAIVPMELDAALG